MIVRAHFLLCLLLITPIATIAQSRVGEGAGTGAAVGGVLGLLVTGDLWGAAEGAAMGAAAGAAGGAVSEHNEKRRQERAQLQRYQAKEMAALEQQRQLELAKQARAEAAKQASAEKERQQAEQQLAAAERERQNIERERRALAEERRTLEATLAEQRQTAVAQGTLSPPTLPTTEAEWIAAIGRDSYEAGEALIDCQHERARLLAMAGGTSDNPDYRLGGKWIEALVALDARDTSTATNLYEELIILDPDIDTAQQASIAADQSLLELRQIRREEGISCSA